MGSVNGGGGTSAEATARVRRALGAGSLLHCALYSLLSLLAATVHCKDAAEVSVVIHRSGPCSDRFLQLRNVDPTRYDSAVQFDPAAVTVDPPNPTIPGCMSIVARSVRVTRPLTQLTAEVEIRVSNKPDLAQPTIPCGQGDAQCQCEGFNNTCLYCGFCRNLARQSIRSLRISEALAKKNHIAERRAGGDGGRSLCECERAEPGVYDLEAQVCTPPGEQLAQHIPASMQDRVAEGRPISLFIALYLYDFNFNDFSAPVYSTPLGAPVFGRRKATGTVGCYLLGTDVLVTAPLGTGTGGSGNAGPRLPPQPPVLRRIVN